MMAAWLLREWRALLVNRLVVFYGGLMLATGLLPLAFTDPGDGTAGHLLLLVSLYLVPLFAVLAGTASAQNEMEEQPLLMSQPVWRGARLAGKWLALSLVLASGTLLLVCPAVLAAGGASALARLGLQAAALAATFAALGLAVGFSTADRVKAHMAALCLWLALLVGSDLVALMAAPLPLFREIPEVWLAILMANPLDTFRVGSLLMLERIPFDPLTAPGLGTWWVRHLQLWFFLIAGGWTLVFLGWGAWRLERMEP